MPPGISHAQSLLTVSQPANASATFASRDRSVRPRAGTQHELPAHGVHKRPRLRSSWISVTRGRVGHPPGFDRWIDFPVPGAQLAHASQPTFPTPTL